MLNDEFTGIVMSKYISGYESWLANLRFPVAVFRKLGYTGGK